MDIELQKVNILLSQRKEMNNDIDGHINPIRINFNNIWLHILFYRNHNGTTL
jgi:hypothetical protein